MDQNDIRTLKILEELDNDHAPSQRDLAKALGVSLGLVNSFLKRLVSKGYFKVTTIPKNRVRYILTQKGAAEKIRLTYAYVERSYRYYKDARHKLRTIFERFEKQKIKRLVFCGTGELAEIAYISMQEADIFLAGVIDEKRQGQQFMKQEILPLQAIETIVYDRVLITMLDRRGDALSKLTKLGVSNSKIIYI